MHLSRLQYSYGDEKYSFLEAERVEGTVARVGGVRKETVEELGALTPYSALIR